MKAQAKKEKAASARRRGKKRECLITDAESLDLFESANEALAMVQGAKLVGGRISVRQAQLSLAREVRRISCGSGAAQLFTRDASPCSECQSIDRSSLGS